MSAGRPSNRDLERARAVLSGPIDATTESHLNACVRCNLCAETCHVFLADREPASTPARKVEEVARLYRRRHTLAGRLMPALVGARELTEDGLAALADAAFARCSQCGRCTINCSVGLDPAAVMRFARAVLHAAGRVPDGIAANAANTLASGNNMTIDAVEAAETIAWLADDLRLTVNDPTAAISVDRTGARVLYLVNPAELKFYPLSLSAAAMVFEAAGEDWTLSSTDFDVTNYSFFAGDREGAAATAARVVRRAEELGVRELVVAECGHGYRTLRWEAPNWLGREFPFAVRSFVEVAAEYLRNGRIVLDPTRSSKRVTLHDPCNLVRHGGVIEDQRELLRAAVADFVEMTPSRADNYCCGGGGGAVAEPALRERRMVAGKVKADQIRATGARVVASPCHNCITQLKDLSQHWGLAVEVTTIAELLAEALVMPTPV
jgi:Fe-S oxidoreductase